MQLLDLVLKVRELYVSELRRTIDDRKLSLPAFVSELLIEPSGSHPEDPDIYRVFRIDMISGGRENPTLSDLNIDSYVSFDPFETTFGRLCMQISPFHWYALECRFLIYEQAFAPFETWARTWLDPEDRRPRDAHGLQGVIHSVTRPELRNHHWITSIDFGSAPVSAFVELLNAFQVMNVTSLEISTSFGVDHN